MGTRRGLCLGLVLWMSACADADGDGRGGGKDCDDNDATTFKGAVEVCDGVDNDCDGQVDEDVAMVAYLDQDGDGSGDSANVRRVCTWPDNAAETGGDCDDADPYSFPGAEERCDGVDNDCNGTADEGLQTVFYEDLDLDGHGAPGGSTLDACVPPAGYAVAPDDCNDADPAAWDDAPEICDGIDNNCDGTIDEGAVAQWLWADADGDGYGDPDVRVPACGPGNGASDDPRDCDDTDASVSPATVEVRGNSEDEDCDGYVDEVSVPDHEPSLEAGLAAVQDGGVLQLGEGTWFASVDLRERDIVFAGEGCDHTVLFADPGTATVTASLGQVSDMTLTGGSLGGLVVEGGPLLGRNLCVSGNLNPDFGGGIEVLDDSTLLLEDSVISDNYALFDGGGISAASGSTLDMLRVHIVDNTAGLKAGGLDVRSASVHGENVVIARNSAFVDGGAWYQRTGMQGPPDVTLVHSTLHANETRRPFLIPGDVDLPSGSSSSLGAAGYVRNGTATLNDVIVSGHNVPDEELIAVGSGADLDTARVAFTGPMARDLGSGWLAEALRSPPLYWSDGVDGRPLDLRLRPESPYRDWHAGPGGTGAVDWDGSPADLGAYGGPSTWEDAAAEGDDDEDGLPDVWELLNGTAPWVNDAAEDPDADGVSHGGEYVLGTDPLVADSDGDGVSDGQEQAEGTDPVRGADRAPVAWATSKDVVVGEAVTLDGDLSWDGDGDAWTASWTVLAPAGGTATLSDPNSPTPVLIPDVEGTWQLTLTVSDGVQTSSRDVTVSAWDAVVVPDDVADLATAMAGLPAAGGAVALRPGVYTAGLSVSDADVVLVGLGASDEVVVDGGGLGPVFSTSGGSFTARHLTLTGGLGANGGGLTAVGTMVSLTDVVVENNDVSFTGGGIYVQGADLDAVDVVVRDNAAGLQGAGVAVSEGSVTWTGGAFLNNAVASNSIPGAGGLWVSPGGGELGVVTVRNTVFQANTAPRYPALYVDVSDDETSVIEHSVFADHAGASQTLRAIGEVLIVAPLVVADDCTLFGEAPGPLRDLAIVRPAFWLSTGIAHSNPSAEPAEVWTENPAMTWFVDNGVADDVFSLRPESPLLDAGWVARTDWDGSVGAVGLSAGSAAPRHALLAVADVDKDGLPDGWELALGLDPTVPDAAGDPDGDGLDNALEYLSGTHPTVAD